MRVLPIVFLCLLMTSGIFAQYEFAPIGAQWIQNASIDEYDGTFLEDYFIITSEKDTLIDSLSFRKVGDYLFYQEEKLVYYWWEDSLRLIYDYGVAVGDTVVFEMLGDIFQPMIENTFIVSSVTQVDAGGDTLKRIACDLIDGQLYVQPYVYLERMGSTRTLVEDLTTSVLVAGAIEDWLRCYKDSTVDYQTERFQQAAQNGEDCYYVTNVEEPYNTAPFTVFPNPLIGDQLSIDGAFSEEVFISVYNTLGREVYQTQNVLPFDFSLQEFPAGMYIRVIRNKDTLNVASKNV